MSPLDRRLLAAQGYLDLGMWLEAHDELEEIEPEMRDLSKVFALKVTIFQRLEKWALVEALAKELDRRHPDEPNWPLALADAIRRNRSMQEGFKCWPGRHAFPRGSTPLLYARVVPGTAGLSGRRAGEAGRCHSAWPGFTRSSAG